MYYVVSPHAHNRAQIKEATQFTATALITPTFPRQITENTDLKQRFLSINPLALNKRGLFWVPVVNKRAAFVVLVLNKRGGKSGVWASWSFAIPEIPEGGNSRKVTDGVAEEPNSPGPRVR
ncbi:hypothetical protein [Pauljensenia sp. OF14-1SRA]|uniref:hypothetical protein n=1 Tax=Pauljensenia sp. OF14-1SRA TaxID=2998062 RepID=UPI0022E15EC5|nr:hypothetical protein [Pauljensenia sp. OF14-1SRA]